MTSEKSIVDKDDAYSTNFWFATVRIIHIIALRDILTEQKTGSQSENKDNFNGGYWYRSAR